MERNGIIMRFFLKHPRFWGSLFIAVAMVGSNAGSAWAGWEYRDISRTEPWTITVGPEIGFYVLARTVYPLCLVLLVFGVYLWSRYKRP